MNNFLIVSLLHSVSDIKATLSRTECWGRC